MKPHVLTAAAKVLLYGLGQERLLKTITQAEYTTRGREIVQDDRARCRKACCKARKN